MKGWVAITHHNWFDVLARERRRDEVNFWSPSDYYTYRTDIIFLSLHSADLAIVARR